VREPMSEKLGRLPSLAFWIVITLLVAVLVICSLGSIIGLIVHAPELQSPHLTTSWPTQPQHEAEGLIPPPEGSEHGGFSPTEAPCLCRPPLRLAAAIGLPALRIGV
jgi:hypothetical protein